MEGGAATRGVAGENFPPAETATVEDETTAEKIAREKKMVPTTVPNDAEVLTALTEGERRIAEKNPRAAEAAFQKVLTKYPDQARAWYGIGLVAMLGHDSARAKKIVGRVTGGGHER